MRRARAIAARLWRGWTRAATLLGTVQFIAASLIVYSTLFALTALGYRVLRRARGRAATNWIERGPAPTTLEEMRRQ